MMDKPPFDSIHQLREAHDALLGRLDAARAAPGSEPGERAALLGMAEEVRAFVARAVATGSTLDEVDDLDERTSAQVLVDYWANRLQRAGAEVGERRLAPFDAAQLPELPEPPELELPYRGAQAFHEGQALYGRTADTQRLVELIARRRLVLVLGPSGCGKSSFVTAGALPALRAQRSAEGRPAWRVARAVRAGPELLQQLAAAVAELAPGCDAAALARALPGDASALARALAQAGAPPALLTIDQADALFDPGAEALRESLAAALAALLADAAGHHVVLILREEFEARLFESPALAPWHSAADEGGACCGRFVLGPMTPQQLQEALVGPVEKLGLHLHPDVVADLVNRLAGQRAALPLLQHALQLLWSARGKKNRIGWDDYLALRDALEAEKWRLEALHQRAAAERERATARRERAAADTERGLARRKRRLLHLAVTGLTLLAGGAGYLLVQNLELAQAKRQLSRGLADMERATVACEDGRQACVAEQEALRSRLAQEAPAGPQAAPAGPAAAPPAPAPAPAPVAAAAAAASAAAEPAPPSASAAPDTALPAPPVAAAPAASDLAAPGAVPAAAALGDVEVHDRARRLVFWLDHQRSAASAGELRRLHPLSWGWARSRADELRLRSPLALAVLYDTAAAHGPLAAAMMDLRADPADGSAASETRLLRRLLERRQQRADQALIGAGHEARRVQELRRLLDAGDLDLQTHPGAAR